VRRPWLLALAAMAAIVPGGCTQLAPEVGPERIACDDVDSDPAHAVSFAKDIRPLMNRSIIDPTGHGCIACHYSTEGSHLCLDQTGLDLATLGTLRRGGSTTGASIVVPGKPCSSGIVQKLQGDYYTGLRMPKDGPAYWSDSQIQLVKDWIAEGAVGEDGE
jgi:hypothetical protein